MAALSALDRFSSQALPLIVVGAASLIWQVASARSLLEALRGNELGLGLVLMSWLLLIGLGSLLGAWLSARSATGVGGVRVSASPLLASLLLLTPTAVLLSLGLQNGSALADPTVVAGPTRTTALAMVSLAPACLLLGAVFALAARAPLDRSAGSWAAMVFALESLGTVGAGLFFHFVLASASLRSAGLVAGGLCWLAALPFLLQLRGRPRWIRWVAFGSALCGALALLYLTPLVKPDLPFPGAGHLVRRLPGYQLLEHRNSPHAALAVLQRSDQLLFTANGQLVFSNQDEQHVETEIHLSLLAHPGPARLLLLGGGLGGGIAEALKHRPQQLDYVELDPALVELGRHHAPKLAAALTRKNVQLLVGDGRQWVRRCPAASYDVILVGLPGPSSALLNRFYTEEFFAAARRALRPGGFVRVALEGGEGYLSSAAVLAHRSVLKAMQAARLRVRALPGGVTLLLGGRDSEPELDPRRLLRRFQERQLATRFLGPAEIVDRTFPFKRDLYLQSLDTRELEGMRTSAVNRDLHPLAYFQASLLWLALGSPRLAGAALRLGEITWRWPWLAPVAGLLLGLLGTALRRRRPAAGLALLAAGLTGLALELEALLACQLARGVVYRELGILTAAFMLGLAFGALAGRRLLARAPRLALTLGLAGCGAAALLTLALLRWALSWPTGALGLLLLDLLLVGGSVGACYPPAAASLAARHGAEASARAYAWDLLGAALGSLLAGGLFLPMLGLPGTSAFCGAICVGGALGLRRGI